MSTQRTLCMVKWFCSYKNQLFELPCNNSETVCGVFPSTVSYSINITSCMKDFYIYALYTDNEASFSVQFEYISDTCRSKNATINERCGSLTSTECRSKKLCDVKCAQVNCTNSDGSVLHQLCLDAKLNMTELRDYCNSYSGKSFCYLDFSVLNPQGKVELLQCKVDITDNEIGILGLIFMVFLLIVLWIIVIMSGYYNYKVTLLNAIAFKNIRRTN